MHIKMQITKKKRNEEKDPFPFTKMVTYLTAFNQLFINNFEFSTKGIEYRCSKSYLRYVIYNLNGIRTGL